MMEGLTTPLGIVSLSDSSLLCPLGPSGPRKEEAVPYADASTCFLLAWSLPDLQLQELPPEAKTQQPDEQD